MSRSSPSSTVTFPRALPRRPDGRETSLTLALVLPAGSFPDAQLPSKRIIGPKNYEFLTSKREEFQEYLQVAVCHVNGGLNRLATLHIHFTSNIHAALEREMRRKGDKPTGTARASGG